MQVARFDRFEGLERASVVALGNALLWMGLAGLSGVWLAGLAAVPTAAAQPVTAAAPDLYQANCAWCHGRDGQGTNRGPSLVGAGAASADFYLRTGRMPIRSPEQEVKRQQPVFDEAAIQVMVDYLAGLGEGPPIPAVTPGAADLSRGGEAYRLNCAACHNWDGKGGALVGRQNAPPLAAASAVEVAEAVRVGPGAMPAFSSEVIDDTELNDLVGYVEYLDTPEDRGGYGLAHWGPSTEGFAGLVALGLIVIFTGWLGERR